MQQSQHTLAKQSGKLDYKVIVASEPKTAFVQA
jgi:hypothetical protein